MRYPIIHPQSRSALRQHEEEEIAMSTAPQMSQARVWKDLYVAALLEGDAERMPTLILAAERAIIGRARELFHAAGDNIQEEQALDDALYALHALRSSLAVHGRYAEAA